MPARQDNRHTQARKTDKARRQEEKQTRQKDRHTQARKQEEKQTRQKDRHTQARKQEEKQTRQKDRHTQARKTKEHTHHKLGWRLVALKKNGFSPKGGLGGSVSSTGSSRHWEDVVGHISGLCPGIGCFFCIFSASFACFACFAIFCHFFCQQASKKAGKQVVLAVSFTFVWAENHD